MILHCSLQRCKTCFYIQHQHGRSEMWGSGHLYGWPCAILSHLSCTQRNLIEDYQSIRQKEKLSLHKLQVRVNLKDMGSRSKWFLSRDWFWNRIRKSHSAISIRHALQRCTSSLCIQQHMSCIMPLARLDLNLERFLTIHCCLLLSGKKI